MIGPGYWHSGALGFVAYLAAVFDWFAILFTGAPLGGLQPFKRTYLGWKARVLAYGAFLRDEYPPFGEKDYPAVLELPPEPPSRDKLLVLLRLFLLIPHLLFLFILMLIWTLVVLIVWLWVSLTAQMPSLLWRFSRDLMEYSLRVETYALLLHDEFPSFALGPAGKGAASQGG